MSRLIRVGDRVEVEGTNEYFDIIDINHQLHQINIRISYIKSTSYKTIIITPSDIKMTDINKPTRIKFIETTNDDLPTLTGQRDIDIAILNNLENKSLINACKVNTYIRDICNDPVLWNKRIMLKSPELYDYVKRAYPSLTSKQQYIKLIGYNYDIYNFFESMIGDEVDNDIIIEIYDTLKKSHNIDISDLVQDTFYLALDHGNLQLSKHIYAAQDVHLEDYSPYHMEYNKIIDSPNRTEMIMFLDWMDSEGLITNYASLPYYITIKMDAQLLRWLKVHNIAFNHLIDDGGTIIQTIGEGPIELFNFVNQNEDYYELLEDDHIYPGIYKVALKHHNIDVLMQLIHLGLAVHEDDYKIIEMSDENLEYYTGVLNQFEQKYGENSFSHETKGEIRREIEKRASSQYQPHHRTPGLGLGIRQLH